MAESAAQWTFHKILLPIDGSRSSLAAARVAVGLARADSAELIVLHVVDDQIIEELSRFSRQTVEEVGKVLEENGWHYLQAVEKMAQEHWVRTTLALRHGTPNESPGDELNQLFFSDILMSFSVKSIIFARVGKRGGRFLTCQKTALCLVLYYLFFGEERLAQGLRHDSPC